MNKLTFIIISVIILLLFSKTYVSSKQQSTLLFVTSNSDYPVNSQLMLIDLEANVRKFNLDRLSYGEFFISSGAKVSARSPVGDLIVYNAIGERIYHYAFPSTVQNKQDWRVWGWQNSKNVIVSKTENNNRNFYTLNLIAPPFQQPLILPIEGIVWDFGEIRELPTVYGNTIIFSPDFGKFLALYNDKPNIEGTEWTTTRIWDMNTREMSIIRNSSAWWLTDNQPSWSHSSEYIAIEGEINDGQSYNVVIYNTEGLGSKVINIVCGSVCEPRNFSWSWDDAKLAYWQRDATRDFPNELLTIDFATSEHISILAGYYVPTPIYWSRDGKYIAFVAEKIDVTADKIIRSIEIIDLSNNKSLVSYPLGNYAKLVGWFDFL